MSSTLIRTIHPDAKKGIVMKLEEYNKFKEMILAHVTEFNPSNLCSLINLAPHIDASASMRENIGWLLMHVKLDLEARGLLINQIENKGKPTLYAVTKPQRILDRKNNWQTDTNFRDKFHERVKKSAFNLEQGDIVSLRDHMYKSHYGLSKLYEVSCNELDFLVKKARDFGPIGSRMLGGGFGGYTINLVEDAQVGEFLAVKKNTSKNSNWKWGFIWLPRVRGLI